MSDKYIWNAIIAFPGAGQRRRLFRNLDMLTVKWVTGDIPEECRFQLGTQLVFLKKEKDSTTKKFDDNEWIRSVTEAQAVAADISEEGITHNQSEVDPTRVRLVAPTEGEITALTTAMRQLGVGSQGGAEALAISHQFIFDEWTPGIPDTPLARIKLKWTKKSFGMIEWLVVRNLSFVEQGGIHPMPKERCAEQGDVDGPSDRSLALETVAAEAAGSRNPLLEWRARPSRRRKTSRQHSRMQRIRSFQLGCLEKSIAGDDLRHALQENGGSQTTGI